MPCSDALSPAAFEQKQCFGAEKTTLGGGVERGMEMMGNREEYSVTYNGKKKDTAVSFNLHPDSSILLSFANR